MEVDSRDSRIDIPALDAFLHAHAEALFEEKGQSVSASSAPTGSASIVAAALILFLALAINLPVSSPPSGTRGTQDVLAAQADLRTSEIRWSGVAGASRYTVEVWDAEGGVLFSAVLSEDEEATHVPGLDEQVDGAYWSVTAWRNEHPLAISGPFSIVP